MSLKLYMDAHVPSAITIALRDRGIDVLTAQEDHTDDVDDATLLDRASSLQRVVFTFDQDFIGLTSHWQAAARRFSGVIILRNTRISFQQCVDELHLICRVYDLSDLENRLEYIPLK